MNVGVHDLVVKAPSADAILDAYCFVQGFTEAEINARIAKLFDDNPKPTAAQPKELKLLQHALHRLNMAWKAFEEANDNPTSNYLDRMTQHTGRQTQKAAEQDIKIIPDKPVRSDTRNKVYATPPSGKPKPPKKPTRRERADAAVAKLPTFTRK